jgi:hypothetical protein
MTAPADDLWVRYQELERRGERRKALAELQALISALSSSPLDEQVEWVSRLCGETIDAGRGDLLRYPLVADFLLPHLSSGWRARNQNTGRWLAWCVRRHPLAHELEALPPTERSSTDILERAIELDPEDARARQLLVEILAQWFDDCVHEVPAGVLYGNVATTVEQCSEMQSDLAVFRRNALALGQWGTYEGRVAEWERHAVGYADYLSHRPEYTDYADYLARHAGEGPHKTSQTSPSPGATDLSGIKTPPHR